MLSLRIESVLEGLGHFANPDHAIVVSVHILGQIVYLWLSQAVELVDALLEATQSNLTFACGSVTKHRLDSPAISLKLLVDDFNGRLGRRSLVLPDVLLVDELSELMLFDLRSPEFGSEELVHRLDFILVHLKLQQVLQCPLQLLGRHHLIFVLIIFSKQVVGVLALPLQACHQGLDDVLDASLEHLLLLIVPEPIEELLLWN